MLATKVRDGGLAENGSGWGKESDLNALGGLAVVLRLWLDSLITSPQGRGGMHIGRANDKPKPGNAAGGAGMPCMKRLSQTGS